MANYRGIPNIEFVWHGEWADPELIYKGHKFNYWDIEDSLWDYFLEGHTGKEEPTDDMFADWVRENHDTVYNMLEDWMWAELETMEANR